MVLEESLLFYTENDATEFIKRLKKKGCHATKRIEVSVIEEMAMEGPLGKMIEVLEEMADDDGEPATVEMDNELDTTLLLAAETIAGSDKSAPATHPLLLKTLRRTRDSNNEIMAKHEVGDIIYTEADFDIINSDLLESTDVNAERELIGEISATLPLISSLEVLLENGLVKATPGGITLIQKVDADEMFIERKIFDPDLFDEDMLDEHDVHLLKNVNYMPLIRVNIDPSLYFTCEDDELIEALDGLDLEEASEKVLLRNFPYKKLIIDSVIEVIETGKKVPLSKIIEQSEEFLPILLGEPYKVVVHAHPETVKGIIDDMRKARVIQGNDAGIRLSGR
ncbi:MAG: hypothetical protein NTZ39_07775 [Methanoregula sp.]|nr:hypothetical protein [Methanoregula sp.]